MSSSATVTIHVVTDDGVTSLAVMTVVRAVSLNVVDVEAARVELTVVLQDNDNQNHVVRFSAEDIGKVMIAAGVNMYEELPGRLLYAADLDGASPALVNPFVYTVVRGHGVPVGTPPGHDVPVDAHAGHDHG
jgi:hypothetical protein